MSSQNETRANCHGKIALAAMLPLFRLTLALPYLNSFPFSYWHATDCCSGSGVNLRCEVLRGTTSSFAPMCALISGALLGIACVPPRFAYTCFTTNSCSMACGWRLHARCRIWVFGLLGRFPRAVPCLASHCPTLVSLSFAALTGALLILERCAARQCAAFASSAQVHPPERCSEYDVPST